MGQDNPSQNALDPFEQEELGEHTSWVERTNELISKMATDNEFSEKMTQRLNADPTCLKLMQLSWSQVTADEDDGCEDLPEVASTPSDSSEFS